MILGLSLAVFTNLHVALSLAGIVAGLLVALAMLGARRPPAMTAVFLLATALTDLSGFLFPIPFDPAYVVGMIDLAALALAALALYGQGLRGAWRATYVVSALFALYLNCFVLVVQSFQKIAFLHQLAPTGKEPVFAATQGILLVAFIGFGVAALRRFKPAVAVAPV
jgi:hypothetical protein